MPPSDPAAFAPANPTDGRGLLDWQSKYPAAARKVMTSEALYLAGHFLCVILAFLTFHLDWPYRYLHIPAAKYASIAKYGLAWAGGTLGGTLFSLKWLYHSVARKIWHEDRHLWRLLTPHVSGGLAIMMTALMSSGLLRVLDQHSIDSHAVVVGFAALVGYFSDSAVGKLTEIAETVFGTTRSKDVEPKLSSESPKPGSITADPPDLATGEAASADALD